MASRSLSRQSQPTAAQSNNNNALLFGTSRATNGAKPNDPLQPLRAMAERVGKEVEKFAERVDHWHVHGNESKKAKYQTTVKLVGKFQDVAESHVKELKRTTEAENKGSLSKTVRRQIQTMADASDNPAQSLFGQSSQSVISSIEPNAASVSANVRELREWQAELATWKLLKLVIEHYNPEPGTDSTVEKQAQLEEVGGTARYCKNSEIWDRFLLEDDQAKEKALVLRWLEQTARDSDSDVKAIITGLEEHSGKGAHTWTSGWLETKTKIKQAKRMDDIDQPLKPINSNLKTSDRTANLVTQLDPDAPSRQKRALERSDEYYERSLWMVAYEMMRRGLPWKTIVDWCYERNESWRGVSIGAAYEGHPEGGPNVAGPTVGYLFRRMCFYAARGARIPYEGAVYGLLSGDLKQVQTVCRSWDDHLYAHYNALLLSRFDSYLQKKHPNRVTESLTQKFLFQDAVANIGDWEGSPEKVMGLLKQQKSTAAQAVSPIKLIQSALIGRGADDLMLKVGVAIADMFDKDERPHSLIIHPDSPEEDRSPIPAGDHRTYHAEPYYQALAKDPHAFRIVVHIFIVLRNGLHTLFEDTHQDKKFLAMDNVITAYIEFLRLTKRFDTIPLYAAQLIDERAAYSLARVLPDIKNNSEQRHSVALMESYRIDVVQVISQSFTFASRDSGFTHFTNDGYGVITNPIKRFNILEKITLPTEQLLWPGVRVKRTFDGAEISPQDEVVIDSVQWYSYVAKDYENTFAHLQSALIIFLLNGRLAAAEKVIGDLSVETLSLSRTEALLGYPFDFTMPGAEEQDEQRLHEHRDSLSTADRAAAIPMAKLPNADRHRRTVNALRQSSTAYYTLQQIVRLLVLFREWREEEQTLIQIRAERKKDGASAKHKPDTQRTKALLDSISNVFDTLIPAISDASAADPEYLTSKTWELMKAYVPDIILAYLSVLQAAAWFLNKDPAIKAMEVAVVVADRSNEWVQRCLLETGRMSEVLECLAAVSKCMLKLTEGGKEKGNKKRGGKGETLRLWDLGAR
ncbi:107-domain-containing protein [Alternaria rosae]|uniref:107-domain-containing protein n=1 Tax=Alternaria rosae TaxID=1187941 RepID=UPI001E8D231C|nr:107-domain-containing protein [Alternaria rosae]KAH6882702.1 107-domain-containing protein [Alternaria rosae]